MVATAHPLASEAGVEILKAGGNAIDAAVAAALALNVVEPHCSGIGGGGFAVIHMADSRDDVMEFRERAPAGVSLDHYFEGGSIRKDWTEWGGRSVAPPGQVRGLFDLLHKYGHKDFAFVARPAIRLASEGFPVTENLAKVIAEKAEILSRDDAAAAIYLNRGVPWKKDEILRNPDLAVTLSRLSLEGPELFYRGEIANAIVRAVTSDGGVLALSDLEDFRSNVLAPVKGIYRGYEIVSMPPPSSGGACLIQVLRMLEYYDLSMDPQEAPGAIHPLAEALKLAFADRERFLADPEFVNVPLDWLLGDAHIAELRKQIDLERAREAIPTSASMEKNESWNTTHISVVDRWGSAVSMTLTINHWFGSGLVVPGYGFLLNDEMADFTFAADSPNRPEGRKRPLSSMTPTIVLKDDRPFLVIGSPGATRIITAVAQIVVNVIDHGMDIDEAIEAPRFHAMSEKGESSPLYIESRFPLKTVDRLRSMGHRVEMKEAYDPYFGGAQGVLIRPGEGLLRGGADSRRDSACAGY
jgi:gamma-glutamyltranspeptidase/glutathione hydrolase